MVTTFNKKDLRSFYYYMISDERREYYENHPQSNTMTDLDKRLKTVNGGDIERWMKWELRKNRKSKG